MHISHRCSHVAGLVHAVLQYTYSILWLSGSAALISTPCYAQYIAVVHVPCIGFYMCSMCSICGMHISPHSHVRD
jgi:hypothetical protein